MCQLGDGHWRNCGVFVASEVKDIEVIKFAQFVEALVKVGDTLIGSTKILCVSCESFKYILSLKGSKRSMEDWSHGAGVDTTDFLHVGKDLTPLCSVKKHQVVILSDMEEVLLLPVDSLQSLPGLHIETS